MKEFKTMVEEVKVQSYSTKTMIPKAKISSSSDADAYFRLVWHGDLDVREALYALFLNRANNVSGYSLISMGGVVGTIIDVRLIAKSALDYLASAIIIAHNHPSGNLSPSEADRNITEKIKNAVTLLEMALLDHLVITPNDGYFSFADEGII